MKQISICIPTWNRYELTIDSFAQVYNDERVKNIIIVDDCSNDEFYVKLALICGHMDKVHLYQNDTNLDCYRNKKEAISKSTSEYCIILDSDNEIGVDYIDAIYKEDWDEDTILAPVYAMPYFDYREFSGVHVNRSNVASYMDKKMFATALNTCNYFVNKEEYLKCFDPNVDPHSSDSIYMAYRWLNMGNTIHFVPNLTYSHLVHEDSHYKLNCSKDPDFYVKIEENLKNMK